MLNDGFLPDRATLYPPPLTIRPGKVCLAQLFGCAGAFEMGGAMAIADMPILSMLRTHMEWAHERQQVLAENVANSDPPTFRARHMVSQSKARD